MSALLHSVLRPSLTSSASSAAAAPIVLAASDGAATFQMLAPLVLTAATAEATKTPIVVVSLAQSKAHYSAIVKKCCASAANKISYVDQPTACSVGDIVIVDDLTALALSTSLWTDTLQRIFALQVKVGPQGLVIVCAPTDQLLFDDSNYTMLVRSLAHAAAARIHLAPLSSGYSRDLDAELVVSDGPNQERVLLKATDTGFVFHSHGSLFS